MLIIKSLPKDVLLAPRGTNGTRIDLQQLLRITIRLQILNK
jgi:hypothetical protein